MLVSYDPHTAKFLSLIPGSLVLITKPCTVELLLHFINICGADRYSLTNKKVQLKKGDYVLFNLLVDEPDELYPMNDNKIQISCKVKNADCDYIIRVPIENCDIDEFCEKHNDKLFQLHLNNLKREELERVYKRKKEVI